MAETRYWEELRTSPWFSVSKAAEPQKDDMIISKKVRLKRLSLLAIVVYRLSLLNPIRIRIGV